MGVQSTCLHSRSEQWVPTFWSYIDNNMEGGSNWELEIQKYQQFIRTQAADLARKDEEIKRLSGDSEGREKESRRVDSESRVRDLERRDHQLQTIR